ETTPDRVRVDGKDDRNNRCGLLERWHCSAKCNYDVDSQSDELSRNLRVSLHAVFRPAMLDRDGSALDPAELAKPFQKRGVPRALRPTRSRAEKPDRRQLLLRARRERPRSDRAAEQRYELAPPCMSRKEHCEGWRGSNHDSALVATGSPQPPRMS